MTRHAELDALRGLLLVLMTLTHLPTRYSAYSSQLFGFVSAAEGFVFLSGLVAGLVYWRIRQSQGEAALRQRLRRRAWQLYGVHLALLLFLFTVGAALGHFGERPMLRNLLSFYFEQPLVALWAGPLLLYQPPLLDILPTYIVLLLATGFWMRLAARRGWATALGLSLLLWAFAQLHGRAWLLALFNRATGDTVPNLPLPVLGYFDDFAWQLLWVSGLWVGHLLAEGRGQELRPRPALAWAAIGATAFALAWFHRWLPPSLGLPVVDAEFWLQWVDKVLLRPLRLSQFLLLAVSLACLSHWLRPVALAAPGRMLAGLGRASLPVFSVHLLLVLLSLGLIQQEEVPLSAPAELALVIGTLAAMAASAWRHGRRGTLSHPGALRAA
ncbi:OpgC domain-containing protein [Stagnimonas aquatica]|uniref:OpgC domain-containing protein n=1 Tax=Stagnimonas aquatica TaxID=2689987 RepID=A0A3N0VKA0_9GAMM|nr:OpgC domain-containing protein [Stagnimonas aquatica]ROH93145.1 OpgC domain-containing protein [Stagnimonas aquatica]